MTNKQAPPVHPLLPEAAMIWIGGTGKWETAYRTDYKRQETIVPVDNIIFNSSGLTYTSDVIECAPYRDLLLLINLDVTGAPTDIVIDVKFSDDGAKFYKYVRGPFGDLRYEDSAGDKMECIDGPVIAPYMQLKLTSTGCDGSKTFLMTVKALLSG